jgi:HEAT repeat protein
MIEHERRRRRAPDEIAAAADAAHILLLAERRAPDEQERAHARAAVEGALTPAFLEAIATRLVEEPERFHVFVDLLERAGETGAAVVVERLAEADSIGDRRIYFDLLHELDASVPALLRRLTEPRWYVVRNAAELLGLLEATNAEPALSALLAHEDGRVRRAAALALARIGTPEARASVRAALASLGDQVGESAATALLDREGASEVARLMEALDGERDDRELRAICMALGRVATRPAVNRLATLAREGPGVPLRVAAAEALGEAGTPEAVVALRALLHDPEPRVRGAALWAVCGEHAA